MGCCLSKGLPGLHKELRVPLLTKFRIHLFDLRNLSRLQIASGDATSDVNPSIVKVVLGVAQSPRPPESGSAPGPALLLTDPLRLHGREVPVLLAALQSNLSIPGPIPCQLRVFKQTWKHVGVLCTVVILFWLGQ